MPENPYPWLRVEDDRLEADMRDTTAAESDRRLVIMQEIRAGRLAFAEAAIPEEPFRMIPLPEEVTNG